MRISVLYKDSAMSVKPEIHEIRRMLAVAEAEGIEARLLRPEQFGLTVTREDKRSILIDGEPAELPDVLIRRMGAGMTYFALAVIRHLERLGVYTLNSPHSIETVRDKLFTEQI